MARKIIGAVLSPIGSLLGLTSKKKAPEPLAVPAAPTVMPIADDAKVLAARKRSIIKQRSRSGRTSTILTGGDRLGG